MRWPWQKADPEHVAELEEVIAELDAYIDSDGGTALPEPDGLRRDPPGRIGGTGRVPDEVVIPATPTYFHVDMTPLRQPEPPKKKPERFVPLLDEAYFEKKRELERPHLGFYSASQFNAYASASHYAWGNGTYAHTRGAADYCRRNGHVLTFGSQFCIRCGEHV